MSNRFVLNILTKSLILFFLINLIFGLTNPLPVLGSISAYNRIFPGRVRLPYGDNPTAAYNLSLYSLEAMFASHEISGSPKPKNEYRVLLIGDSATWGYYLRTGETSAAHLNAEGYTLPDGRALRFFNLGYPVMSLAKDLLVLTYAKRYQPDLIVWLVTLESFPYDKQLFPPLVQNNPVAMRKLIQEYHLRLNQNDPGFADPAWYQRNLIVQRRPLADLIRLQLYGVLWAATGIDQDIPQKIPERMEDLPAEMSFHNLQQPLQAGDLAFDVLEAGISMAGRTPIVIVNEPMFISHGANSDIRYNSFYPRWAYDDYRRLLNDESQSRGWSYWDFWDVIPSAEFTNTPIHLTPRGSSLFAQSLGSAILEFVQPR
jgi:hypothetical protein